MKKSSDAEKEAVSQCVHFMSAAARTAPKTRGIDNIVVHIADTVKDMQDIARAMREIASREKRPGMERDAGCIENLSAMVIIGARDNPAGLNCGFCGYKTCEELGSSKGVCAFNSIDLGIAAGSAVTVAGHFHIDNRIMHSIGRAAIEIGILEKDVVQALGIPLSVSGKNPFFDRT